MTKEARAGAAHQTIWLKSRFISGDWDYIQLIYNRLMTVNRRQNLALFKSPEETCGKPGAQIEAELRDIRNN